MRATSMTGGPRLAPARVFPSHLAFALPQRVDDLLHNLGRPPAAAGVTDKAAKTKVARLEALFQLLLVLEKCVECDATRLRVKRLF